MMRLDSAGLAEMITNCFDRAMDGSLPPEEQVKWQVEGKRLRGVLVNVLTAQFVERTGEIQATNDRIRAINAELKGALGSMQKRKEQLEAVNAVVRTVDSLLKFAAFV
jgi:hypothetical protein